METITIPSPTSFLASPVLKPAPEPPPPPKRKPPQPTKTAAPLTKPTGIVKPKQSKSRNGCITCKAKRLKCDETHPACQQCHKRSVTCGGYKKDFKWRPFEETAFVNKSAAPPKAKRRDSVPPNKPQENSNTNGASPSDASSSSTPREAEHDVQMQESFFHAAAPTPPPPSFTPPNGFQDMHFDHAPMFDMSTPPYMRELPRPRFEADTVTRSLSSLFEDNSTAPPNTARPSFSGQSPRLIDLLLPGSELNARPGSVTIPPMVLPNHAMEMSPMMDHHYPPPMELPRENSLDDPDIEEIIREPQMPDSDMWMSLPGPLRVSRSNTASPATITRDDPFNKIYRQPEVQAGSPEMLMLRFDKQTCGILSVKDGPTENPWRTLVWPLARDSPALYHAIASMTAFHTSKEKPALRVDGMEHMRRSIRSLATGIEKMRTDTALATTLVLAFSESWDQHISTGIEHLRGARILVNQALVSHKKQNLMGDDFARLKFLCNTWVYMDVIARLTSIDDDDTVDFEQVLAPLNMESPNGHAEIDPLMGCASTLFPIIGRVANLCRKVRKVDSNSIAIISQAIELKEAIVQWSPPPLPSIERPEDPTSEIQHALQTAEAYRYATLLYLHQAVPEIPSWTSAQLAKKVLVYLATVPLSSRLVIVQIYPLLAAGCEAYEKEDRQWVEQRWHNMANRMWIGNIDRCWEVMQEVWARRDAAEAAKQAAAKGKQRSGAASAMMHSESSKRKFEEELAMEDMFSFSDMLNGMSVSKRQRSSFSGTFSPTHSQQQMMERRRVHEPLEEEMDFELTVRGKLHWVGVMQDWEWEILLG
ncbi:probable acriflavine sensitivity control protein ACR-2 [Phialocephala subalpina]|uniref:Probable acriflavine sensitivity control protein ACR-2 n=1 Tax=Phialocephala subalpina TaxID=576137 RepID=A0A1L7XEY9_9HELO|nr:probable acriflavine sensitivity control protein ACR-2 [Phialocephala subalpina]